jgi:hypothetical protein
MLVKICKEDGIPLVNVVRSEAQEALLRGQGAEHVLDSSAPDFLPICRTPLQRPGRCWA